MPTVRRTKKPASRIAGPERWSEWVAYLESRSTLPPAKVLPPGRRGPLAWCRSGAIAPVPLPGSLGHRLEGWTRGPLPSSPAVVQHLEPWLWTIGARVRDEQFALECLGWSYLLPQLAAVLPAATWREALDALTGLAADAAGTQTTLPLLVDQLLTGELPWTLAYQFPELAACRALGRLARRRSSERILQTLDACGLPPCAHLDLVRPWLASWTRSLSLVGADGRTCFTAAARARYARFVRQALQLSRQDGEPVFSTGRPGLHDWTWLDAAVALAGGEENAAIADQRLPWRAAARAASARQVFFPDSSVNSPTAQLASLRPDWLRGGEQLVIGSERGVLRSELNCGATTLWSGDWPVEVCVGERRLRPQAWQEICWHSDDDVDYLELEAEWSGSWRLERQILLAREDRFLWIADALIGPQRESLEYRSVLPLASGVEFQGEPQTREGYLVHRRRLARILPLALPEWRTAAAGGSLEAVSDGLLLRQQARGQRLYAPLFIDLRSDRMKWPVTWRQLTVGERLEIQPPDVAVGYRVHTGGDQWLFYRSLAPPASRTLLGQNVLHEFLAARFDVEGDADELLAIDPLAKA